MLVFFGLLIVLSMVVGGYVLAGGKIDVVMEALPYEMMIIGGAAIGAFIVANKLVVIKQTGKAIIKSLTGPKWKKDDYRDLLVLLFELIKIARTKGMLQLEPHIESPEESEFFQAFPKILNDKFSRELICDLFRLMTLGFINQYQVENHIQNHIDKHHHEALKPALALQTMADGLPAIGIVAAVLGVIKTMASVTEPPEILGKMIGGALTGTFLGVFLSYCLVGPIANKIISIIEEESQFYLIIRDIIIAHLQGNAPIIATEIGRANIPSHLQPTFYELEAAVNNDPIEEETKE